MRRLACKVLQAWISSGSTLVAIACDTYTKDNKISILKEGLPSFRSKITIYSVLAILLM